MVFLLRPDGAALVVAAERAVPLVLAQAEEPAKKPGLFKFLFGGKRKAREAKPPEKSKAEPRKTTRKKATRKKTTRKKKRTVRRRTGTSKAKIIIAPRKAYDGPVSNVLVIGDFMAQAMAGGLVAAFRENPEIQIVNAAEGASGLVRDDYFNWVRFLPELVTKFTPAAIVIMVGANDRQPFRTGSGRIQTDTDEWRTAYAARVRELTNAVAIAKIPTYWAGLVPVSKASLSRDYSKFNTIYREAATSAGIPFVDLWGGFADDQGKFAARGPDI
ncbi:MAG: SGNH/GDSL hydrolase family protein, partial [Alphaproteobacteria bacterium]